MATTTNQAAAPVSPGAPTPGGDRRDPASAQTRGTIIMPDNTDDPFAPLPGDVIDLDDPSPEMVLWGELTEAFDPVVMHHGDASLVIPFERPSWAHIDCDEIGISAQSTFYRSAVASVASSYSSGHGYLDGDQLLMARCGIRLRIDAGGVKSIVLAVHRTRQGEWQSVGNAMTLTEARQVAAALLAAVALLESE